MNDIFAENFHVLWKMYLLNNDLFYYINYIDEGNGDNAQN